MFKFRIGDRVKKTKGYSFEGVIVSRYKTHNGNRYDVQVQADQATMDIGEMSLAYSFPSEITEKLLKYAENCDGMIHIFAEEQLELV